MRALQKEFFEEDEWAMKHYKELQEKYPDQWVVIKNQQVIRHGINISQRSTEYSIFVSSGAEIL